MIEVINCNPCYMWSLLANMSSIVAHFDSFLWLTLYNYSYLNCGILTMSILYFPAGLNYWDWNTIITLWNLQHNIARWLEKEYWNFFDKSNGHLGNSCYSTDIFGIFIYIRITVQCASLHLGYLDGCKICYYGWDYVRSPFWFLTPFFTYWFLQLK